MSFGDGQMVNFQNMSGEPVFSKKHTQGALQKFVFHHKKLVFEKTSLNYASLH
jgi:hypothetical protein